MENIVDIKSYIDERSMDLIEKNKKEFYKKIKISAIILCCNEEKFIDKCISSLINKVDEIIVIDTGSTDNSISLINKFDSNIIKIYSYEWNDDFSKCRNYGISKATGNWIIFVDADEELSKEISYEVLHSILLYLANFKYSSRLCVYPLFVEKSNDQIYNDVPRIFMNSGNMYYYGFVHEEIRSKNDNIIYISSNILFSHDGYRQDIFDSRNKTLRNTKLIKKMLELEPNSIRWNYYYIRDGYNVLDKKILKNRIANIILIDEFLPITKENIIYNNYTFQLLTIMCKILLEEKKYKEICNITNIMNEIIPQNSNGVYYDVLSKFLNIKEQENILLNKLLAYRKSNFDSQLGMISTEGYHIDLLIGLLLFENMDYAKACRYFAFLKNKFNDKNTKFLVDQYLSVLSKIA